MKRLFAFLLWFAVFFQNFAPAVVIAQELAQDEQEQQQEEVVSSPEPSSKPEDSEEESTETQEEEEDTTEEPTAASPSPSPQSSSSPSPSPAPSPTPSPAPSASPFPLEETATKSASLNSAASAQTSTSSGSGGSSGGSSSSSTQTGNASAVSSTTNAANNTVNASKVNLVNQNLSGNEDADLNELWCEEPKPQQSTVPTEETPTATESASMHDALLLDNEATVESTLAVSADTGDNEVITDGDGTILTGDAIAIANLINLLNSTFIDSQLLIAMLNVWPEFMGDIILPRPEMILGKEYVDEDGNSVQFTADQWAEILNYITVEANTGGNTASASGGLNEMTTGSAFAAANVSNFANLLLQNQGKYGLWINVAADWNGSVYGADDQRMQLAPGLYFFNFGSMLGLQSSCGGMSDSPCMPGSIGLNNSAHLTNNVHVSANTGGNTVDADGNSVIHTGNATAIANVFNMVNSTFLQSQMFFGFVNILGDWNGNIWFAYPDVGVNLTADKKAAKLGDTVTYTVNYKNGGKDAADDVEVDFLLPAGAEYVSDSLGRGIGNFEVGTLQPGQGGSFQVTVKVNDWDALAQAAPNNGLLAKIIRPAYADSDQREIKATARIITSEPQSSTRNDQSIYRTAIYREIEDLEGVGGPSEEEESDLYDIGLQMEHNVGEYVFPGDVVTFTARIRNENDISLENVALMHQILDEDGNILAELAFPIGNLGARKTGLLTFGMQVPEGQLLSSVNIQTRSWVTGTAEDGSPAESSVSSSNFVVRPQAFQFPLTTLPGPQVAPGVEATNGEVLGAVSNTSSTNSNAMVLWQAVAILLFVFLTVRMLRRLEQRRLLLPTDSAL